MVKAIALQAVAGMLVLVHASGCCSSRPSIADFRKLSLDQQIAGYRRALGDGCLKGTHYAYLFMISDHGLPAVDAMAALIRSPQPDFPVHDAVIVIGFVNAKGVDLRNHEVHDLLADLARHASDSWTREEAQKTLIEVDTRTKKPMP